MGIFGNLFGGEKPADSLSDRDKQMAGMPNPESAPQSPANSEGEVDFLNHPAGAAQSAESAPAAAPEQSTPQPEAAANPPAVTASAEVNPSDADVEQVVNTVNQQLEGTGFKSSESVIIQPSTDVSPESTTPTQPESLETTTPAAESAPVAPEQPIQPGNEKPEAG